MKDRTRKPQTEVPYQFGVTLESAIARRERFADRYDYDFGHERVFPELVAAMLDEVPEGAKILEVGAATGLLTQPLLGKARAVTALEPSAGMLKRLLAKEVASDARLETMQGLVEDLPEDARFEYGVVTFTPRRGMGLLHLLVELAGHVSTCVVMLLDEDGTLDWAYLARAASIHGFDVHLHLVTEECGRPEGREPRRAVVLAADVGQWCREVQADDLWEFEARTVDVPYPSPRGAATRLMRYFLAGGDRALLIRTERAGVERLYGNMRTAAHRLGRDEVTVRRMDDGVQIVRLPRANE